MTIIELKDWALTFARQGKTIGEICKLLNCHPETARSAVNWAHLERHRGFRSPRETVVGGEPPVEAAGSAGGSMERKQ